MSFSINYGSYTITYLPSGTTISLTSCTGSPINLSLSSTVVDPNNGVTYTLVSIGASAFFVNTYLTSIISLHL